jgi:hypothetical protein
MKPLSLERELMIKHFEHFMLYGVIPFVAILFYTAFWFFVLNPYRKKFIERSNIKAANLCKTYFISVIIFVSLLCLPDILPHEIVSIYLKYMLYPLLIISFILSFILHLSLKLEIKSLK